MGAEPQSRLRVGIILAPHFTLTAFAGFVDALRLAADEGDRSNKVYCHWEILAATLDPVMSSCGASVAPTAILSDPAHFDCIAVVGGLLREPDAVPDTIYQFIKAAARLKIELAGLCTGSFILARAGLLDGYLTCVSWFHRDEFTAAFPHCRVTSNQMFVVDRDRMTCAGGTSVVHLSAYLIERAIGRAMAVKALRIMLEDQPLPSRALQPEEVLTRQSRDPLVHKAMLLIEQSLNTPGPVSQAYQQLGVSGRQIERRFANDVGISPARYRARLRMRRAVWLLRNTDLSITDIALECGFQDGAHFAQTIRAQMGMRPRQVREDNG
ncbi:MAG: GlxA family transcriptional regulator [Burkholderiaceae bacterium]|nr:GlxA family transcriptional regulator [Burkholderiaceae bacterium]